MSNVLKVKNFEILNALPNHTSGEIAHCEEEDKYYIYKEDEWQEYQIKIKTDGVEIGLYEMNKQIISQLPPFTEEVWKEKRYIFEDWAEVMDNNFYMLYGKEISYFTVFQRKKKIGEFDSFFEAFRTLLNDFGDVYALDIVDNNIEVWVKYEDSVTYLCLFKYDEGMVTFNG